MGSVPYKGYSIVDDGPGFYRVLSPDNEQVGTCEGSYTAREIVDEHIRKVYTFYRRNCRLSPLQAKAAYYISNHQAEAIIEAKGLDMTISAAPFVPDESDIAAMSDRDFR